MGIVETCHMHKFYRHLFFCIIFFPFWNFHHHLVWLYVNGLDSSAKIYWMMLDALRGEIIACTRPTFQPEDMVQVWSLFGRHSMPKNGSLHGHRPMKTT